MLPQFFSQQENIKDLRLLADIEIGKLMKLFSFQTINWQHWFTIAIASILGMVLSSCNLSALEKEVAQVPEMVTGMLSDPSTFNYALNQEFPNIFLRTYEGLVGENSQTAEIEPALAESWEISEDGLEFVFTLREGLKWSDGEPLDADDVVFTYNDVYLNEEIPTDARDALRIGESRAFPKVEKLDDLKVKFTLPESFAPFLGTAELYILPEHALREAVETKNQDGKPKFLSTWGVDTPPKEVIVNGPYQLARYQTNQRVIFRRNPYYWRKDEQGNQLPYIERMVWEIVENTDTSLLQFRSGGLDAVGLTPEFFSLLKREEDKGDFRIYNAGPAYGQTFFSFNLNKGKRDGKPLVDPVKSRWFNTVEFRRAVAHAIDREGMVNNIFRGIGEPQNSPLSIQSPFYLSPKEGLPVYDYDLDKSRQLLKEAGFEYKGDELFDSEGNRIRFRLITNAGNKIRESMAAQIKQDLSKIGIQVDFSPIAFNTLVEKLSNSLEWECYLLGFTGGNEPNSGSNLWNVEGGLHTFNQKPLPGQAEIEGREVYNWEQQISDLYIQGAREIDIEKRKEIYGQTQILTQEYLPMIHLVNPLALGAVRNHIEGVEYVALPDKFWNSYEIKDTSFQKELTE